MIVEHRAWMIAAVAVGGALGTVARYELALAEPVRSGRFPWATFTANMLGSLLLGIVVVVLAETRGSTGALRAFAAVGFCGGLTTFSTWMVESVLLTRDGARGTAALYLAGQPGRGASRPSPLGVAGTAPCPRPPAARVRPGARRLMLGLGRARRRAGRARRATACTGWCSRARRRGSRTAPWW